MQTFYYGKDQLTIAKTLAIAQGQLKGRLHPDSIAQVNASREAVETIVREDITVYGVNTGFGSLCTTRISPADAKKLQYNILRSHSVGVGSPIPTEIAKIMLILKVQALAQGYSGIALPTLERLIWHIENDVIPIVPCQGSVGASGDLAPLAHACLPLIGQGKVVYKGEVVDTAKMFQAENLQPIELAEKEGLALINGTQFIAAFAVKVAERLHNCLEHADLIGAMSLESLLGSVSPFGSEIHQLRPYKGNKYVAHRLKTLLQGSEMLASHANCERVQDPYSLRCMPQVHGASRHTWLHIKELLHIELNSVTDNPIIFNANFTVSGGNFHGQPLALPLDYATLAASEIGNISDRRIYLLLEGEVGLPKLLMRNTGINSGFMLPQYTSAALASENKTLCFPASADSIPTSLGQEDHVSMGSISGRKALAVIGNLENILAVELLCAAQAFDFRRPMKSGKILEACHAYIRSQIHHAEEDRVFADDIQVANRIISEMHLREIADRVAEEEKIDWKTEISSEFGLD
jgi:histidine ammonia-lyase